MQVFGVEFVVLGRVGMNVFMAVGAIDELDVCLPRKPNMIPSSWPNVNLCQWSFVLFSAFDDERLTD